MNSDFVLTGSQSLAERLAREGGTDTPAKIRLAWQLIYGRSPSAAEIEAGQKFIAVQILRIEDSAKSITTDPTLGNYGPGR